MPQFAETYIAGLGRRTAERVVVRFHGWLQRTGKQLADISGRDLAEFSRRPGDRPVGL
jgi:hypothetical protein